MAALQNPGRVALLMCSAVLAGLSAEAACNSARAQEINSVDGLNAAEAISPVDLGTPVGPLPAVSFVDPAAPLAPDESQPLAIAMREGRSSRFSELNSSDSAGAPARHYEFELSATGERVGVPLDMSIAQRGSLGADAAGDIDRQGRGAELRVGNFLAPQRRENERREPSWYVFAASDDEALTWNPGAGSSFSLQDRVEIGDAQLGVTYERGTMQASFAVVQREVSTHVGVRSFSEQENFAGFTLTMTR